MSNSNNLRGEIKEQTKKLKDMTFKEKRGYIFEYYKIHIISILVVILVIASTLYYVKYNSYKTELYIAVVDGKMSGLSEHTDTITNEFTKYLGIDGKSKRVIFDNSFTLIDPNTSEDAYYTQQKLAAMATANSLDGFISEYKNINFLSSGDDLFLTDLNEVLSPDELSKISDYLVYYTTPDGTKIPYAVSLADTSYKKDTDLNMSNPCYGIVATSKHPDQAAKFIKFIFHL